MTKLLERAFKEASKLSEVEQNALARWLIEEILSERKWEKTLAESEDILEKLGYELVEFSPLLDTKPPDRVEAFYFGGGYPELYAEALSNNEPMRQSILRKSHEGAVIYAECGGLMYLGRSITTIDGKEYPMSGCMNYRTCMRSRLRALGYVEICPDENFFILNRGQKMRGHAFHYSDIMFDTKVLPNFYSGSPADKAMGYKIRNTLASYVHLHFSNLAPQFHP